MGASEIETTIDSRMAFEGRLINVRVDSVRFSDGRESIREVVEHSDCVSVVALNSANRVVLVRQYRKAINRFLIEVPAGGIDPEEKAENAALRELKEETGYTAEDLQQIAFFWTTPGFCTEGMYVFVAKSLSAGLPDSDEDENIDVVEVSLSDIPAMIESGDIQDAKTIVSLMLVLDGVKAGRW